MANPAFKVTVKDAGKTPLQFIKDIDAKLHFEFQEVLLALSEETVERMREIIRATPYRLEELAGRIHTEILNDIAGLEVGIGKVADLPIYWEAFNTGFKPKPTGKNVPIGGFEDGAPDANKSGGKWWVGAGKWTFTDLNDNKKVIPPILYIDIAAADLVTKIEKAIVKLSAESV